MLKRNSLVKVPVDTCSSFLTCCPDSNMLQMAFLKTQRTNCQWNCIYTRDIAVVLISIPAHIWRYSVFLLNPYSEGPVLSHHLEVEKGFETWCGAKPLNDFLNS